MYSDPTPAKVRGGAAAAAQSHGGFVTPRSSRTSAAPVVGCLPLSRLLLPLLVMVSCFPLLAADSTQYVYTPSTTCTYANNLDLQDKPQQCCGIKTSIIVDGAVEKIKSKAFYGCSTVTSVDLAAAALLLSIGSEAFYGTSIVSLDFSPLVNLSTVGDYAFNFRNEQARVGEVGSGVDFDWLELLSILWQARNDRLQHRKQLDDDQEPCVQGFWPQAC